MAIRQFRGWLRRWRLRLLVGGLSLFVLIQLVPYGRAHARPASTTEPKWDSTATRSLFLDACGDCHSNLTTWPWYSNVAPISWLTQSDVDGGRRTFDVSNWDTTRHIDTDEFADVIKGGAMPPIYYLPLHPRARLSGSETELLIAGLERSLAAPAG